MFSLKNRIALVTGASRGLGRALAIGLAEAGADVALVARDEDRLRETRTEIEALGRNGACFVYDFKETDGIGALVDRVENEFGCIDILLNNAGMNKRSPAAQFPEASWDDIMQVNLKSVWLMCQSVGCRMLERGSGKIVNIASLGTFIGGVLISAYVSSKGGVGQLTKALANEWAGKGLNVNAIAPGYMRTDMTADLLTDPNRSPQLMERIPAGRFGEPEDLVGAAVFLASDASRYVNGHILVVDGGWMGR